MYNQSQTEAQWKDKKLGFSNLTIGQAGCVVTSIGNMTSLHPDYVNDQLKAHGGFQGAAVVWNVAANLWNLQYNYNTDHADKYPCIAVTDHYKRIGYPTHFFLMISPDYIIDPLNGQTEKNPYNIIGYRNLSPK